MLNKNEVGLFLMRVALGIVFIAHGSAKFQDGIANTAGWFDSIGIPGFMAYIVAIIELVGGIALILGVGTKIVSALIGFIMLGAIITVKLPAGFLDGYAYDFVLLIMAVCLVLSGSNLYSLGQVMRGKDHKETVRKSA